MVGDVCIMRIVGRFQLQNIVNTMHYEVTVQVDDDAVLWGEFLNDWKDANQAAWIARHSDAYTLIGAKAFTVKGDNKPPGDNLEGVAGGVAGDPQEAYVCRTITLYSDNVSSRVRGRVMLSGGAESMFDDTDGSVTDTEVTALNPLALLLRTEVVGASNSYKPVLFDPVLDTTSDLIQAIPRKTPSLIRSRRTKRFLIG